MQPGISTPGDLRKSFDELAGLPAAERAAALQTLREKDPQLAGELENLLRAYDRRSGFLEVPAPVQAADASEPDLVGRITGPYRITREISRGGMGIVYEAVRVDDAFQKRVAFKVVRGLAASEFLRDRFRRERQILADLEHPYIARILDGGSLDDGRLYLVMEYVEGVPIDAYAEIHRLGLEARLDLFCRVCEAVEFAHRHLIVHRDLKPANILVTADGKPKLLDFGIAKILAEHTAEENDVTRTGLWLMTPEHASPEQIRGQPITTASDVFLLGLLLYELLTLRHPFARGGELPHEVMRVICEEEPPRPSAAARAANVRWSARLRGDLDKIALMALRKEPSRRYASVEQLAADIRRFADGKPVAAQGDRIQYRFRKFVRRRWLALAAAAVTLVSLAGAVLVSQTAAYRARQEARQTEEVQDFLVRLFSASDPAQAQGQKLTARALLDRGAASLAQGLRREPELQARLAALLAQLYMQLGEYGAAQPLYEQALRIQQGLYGRNSWEAARSIAGLSMVAYFQGRFQDAGRMGGEAAAIAQQVKGADSLEAARLLNELSWLRRRLGYFEESERMRRTALDVFRQRLGPDNPETNTLESDLAVLLADMGKLPEAEEQQRKVLAVDRAQLGPAHPDTLNATYQLARVLVERGKLSEAETLLGELIPVQRTVLGERHDRVAMSQRMLAWALDEDGRYGEAARNLEDALAIQIERLGPRDAQVSVSLRERGWIKAHSGDLAGAESDARTALAVQLARLGENNYDVAATRHLLGWVLLRRKRIGDAAAEAETAYAIERKLLGDRHYKTGFTLDLLGEIAAAQHDAARSVTLFRQALDILRSGLGEDHPATLRAHVHVDQALAALANVRK